MVAIELICNLALLIALSIVSGFIEKHWSQQTHRGRLLQGVLFGSAAVIGMLQPLDLGSGLIFDGRSVMVSLCVFFFGPLAGMVAASMTILCRMILGGAGTLTGVLVILASLGIGWLAHVHCQPIKRIPSARTLYLFGLLVHLVMLGLMFTLPGGAGSDVVARIGLPVILLYPLATILVGKILSDQISSMHTLEALQAKEVHFRLLVENAPDAIFVQTAGCFAYLNKTTVRLFGADSEHDLIGTSVLDRFHPDIREITRERIRLLNEEKQNVPLLHEVGLRMDGSSLDVEASAVPMRYGGEDGALVFARDITERLAADKSRQKLEEQLQQAQKIETVGRLAGGVAHDYNNMLSVIIGYAELGQMRLAPADPLHDDFNQILIAAKRSRDITRQLLAFARKQTLSPRSLDLNATIGDILKMLARLIGENINLVWRPTEGLWPVEMDPSQLDQILANLCINASDAIGDVGKITIETDMVRFDQAYCDDHTGFLPGDYVKIAVSDDGCGMGKETLEHIFEPFFTTKKAGTGTGLGLSTVYGSIKQSNGFLNVYSEPGAGTIFKIYLPRYKGQLEGEIIPADEQLVRGQGQLVLVVEDEQLILNLTEKILLDLGYKVLTALTPTRALALVEEYAGEIQLLITDVVMPEMNGREMTERVWDLQPRLKCLYMSGYTADAIAHRGVLDKGLHFIQKPFSRYELGQKIGHLLSQSDDLA